MLSTTLLSAVGVVSNSFLLQNAADEGVHYPWVGLGTGGYGFNVSVPKPECWAETNGCGETAEKAIDLWLKLGGKRIDDADSYFHQNYTGKALAKTTVPRDQYFYLSKVGPSNSLGYNDTLMQVDAMLHQTGLTYADAILIHWPISGQQGSIAPKPSTDPFCQNDKPTYNEKNCRLSTWRALLKVWKDGKARAVGVSNFNVTHIQEIIDAGLPLPAINQRPYNPHRSGSSRDITEFCKKHNILFNGYSPLGTPDIVQNGGSRGAHPFPPSVGTPTLLEEPILRPIAKAHGITAAQVILAWHWAKGIPTNPRSVNSTHMTHNLESQSVVLTDDEVAQIDTLKEDWCDLDPTWYECAARNGICPPQCCTTPPCHAEADGSCCGSADE